MTDVTARQRWPWNNLVDIDYTISGVGADTEGLYIRFEVSDPAAGWRREAAAFDREPPLTDGPHRVTWDPEADGVRPESDTVVCRATLRRDDPQRYLLVDLSGGPTAASYKTDYLPAAPAGGWGDAYKTNHLVMRKVDPGTFTMGEGSKAREVTLTAGFYIGVFEVTQKQYELVTGKTPSSLSVGDFRPAENVSYTDIRGTASGTNWPSSRDVDTSSFMGRLRSRTNRAFDLPTDAQWEYACRAGTTTKLNSGKNLSNTTQCQEMDEVGRYQYNGGKRQDEKGKWTVDVGATDVGSYKPNAWGLYDMHGNVWEWCRDWYTNNLGTAAATNPAGPASGSDRVVRGGCWNNKADDCRSANRYKRGQTYAVNSNGFRPVCPAGGAE